MWWWYVTCDSIQKWKCTGLNKLTFLVVLYEWKVKTSGKVPDWSLSSPCLHYRILHTYIEALKLIRNSLGRVTSLPLGSLVSAFQCLDRRVLQCFLCGWWNSYTAMIGSTRASLVGQVAPRAGEGGVWEGEVTDCTYCHLQPDFTQCLHSKFGIYGRQNGNGTSFRPVQPVSPVRVFTLMLQFHISRTYRRLYFRTRQYS
jgi:hypothetical protein